MDSQSFTYGKTWVIWSAGSGVNCHVYREWGWWEEKERQTRERE